jgi:hypothetical protein
MVRHKILILILSTITLGCSKGTPEFALLDQNVIPQPKFSGLTTKNISSSSDSETYQISGECDPKIRSLSAMPVNVVSSFSTIDSYTVSNATVNCASTGTFSFELKSLTALGYTVSQNTTYEIQLRGLTSAGNSNPSYIRIRYTNPVGAPRLTLAGGGVHSASTLVGRRISSVNFNADVTMNYLHSPILKWNSTNFGAKLSAGSRF